ncbi:MAG TPA: endo-1,4-beta-xylanase [Tepidisphaeraceae bacterium]|nr:endo-1,4-beta-xylanase [Tepidisphaeraceae bacterium]
MNEPLARRTFLIGTAAAAAALAGCRQDKRPTATLPTTQPTGETDLDPSHGLGAEEANAPTVGGDRGYLRVMLTEVDGSSLAPDRARLLHARDLNNDPLPQAIIRADGRVRVAIANEPIQVVCRLKIPDFGEVYVYADNEGLGYHKPGEIDFVVEAAKTRLHRVREAIRAAATAGMRADVIASRRLHAAAVRLQQGRRSSGSSTAAAYEALSLAMHAGESFALNAAKHRISRFPEPRKDFGFGVMVSKYGQFPAYDEAVEQAFNFATGAWYTWKTPEPPYVDYARMDGSIDWCLARGITPKSFGYCYMARGAMPEWIRPVELPATTLPTGEQSEPRREYNPAWPYPRVKQLYEHINRQTCAHFLQKYGDRVPHVEVLNEAHDKANLWHMDHERILDLARAVTRAAREGHPRIKRMINHCCQWAEYAVRRNRDGSRRWSPLTFAQDCLANGVEFETLGLQLYYPSYDVFEIDRMLQRHFVIGKPIHITEMSTSAKPGQDPESMRPKSATPPWHGEAWNETLQADWLEAMFTLCYSHPQIEVAQWWDLADVGGHFWPHGGLLNKDMSPKESFHRLLRIQKDWGVAKSS